MFSSAPLTAKDNETISQWTFLYTGDPALDIFPFKEWITDEESKHIAHEWKQCLQVKENEKYRFSFAAVNTDRVFVHSTGVRMNDGLVCLIGIARLRQAQPGNDNVQQYKKEYAEFIDHAAHDLDAPLRKLGVLIERLVEKTVSRENSAELGAYVQRIDAGIKGMRSLIDSLANLSRVNTESLKTEPCPVEAIIEEAWWELKQQVNENHATIHTVGSSLPVLECDHEQCRRLFLELFTNSLRFRKKDEAPRIEIYASPLSQEERKAVGLPAGTQYFQITVSDNGIGFRQDDAEKIFRPFIQLHGKSAFPGNGIGLALCKRIIENHRGTIFAKSAEDAGARFIFILPQTIN